MDVLWQVYLKGDFVFREGEVSREMYFIKSGAVQVTHSMHASLCLDLHACCRA